MRQSVSTTGYCWKIPCSRIFMFSSTEYTFLGTVTTLQSLEKSLNYIYTHSSKSLYMNFTNMFITFHMCITWRIQFVYVLEKNPKWSYCHSIYLLNDKIFKLCNSKQNKKDCFKLRTNNLVDNFSFVHVNFFKCSLGISVYRILFY